MVKRVVSLLAAVFMVCASSFSVSAWSADSFVADSSNYYKLFPSTFSVQAASDSSSNTVSFDCSEFFHNGSWVTNSRNEVYLRVTLASPIREVYVYYPFPTSGESWFVSADTTSGTAWQTSYHSVPDDLFSDYVALSVYGPVGDSVEGDSENEPNFSLTYDLDISSFGEFSAFEIGGNLNIGFAAHDNKYNTSYCPIVEMNLLVDGTVYQTFRPDSDNHFTLSSTLCTVTQNISSVSLQFVYSRCPGIPYDSSSTYNGYILVSYPSTFYFTVLSNDEILNGYTDEAQDSINQHDQIEADWVGQMDQNFNSLDLDTASYPSGLVSGFQLLSGIFMDIWNGLGDLHLIFTIPLTLGIVLVLIGRISKAVSNRSGRAEEKGDNSA